jgi:hypothetical protein
MKLVGGSFSFQGHDKSYVPKKISKINDQFYFFFSEIKLLNIVILCKYHLYI